MPFASTRKPARLAVRGLISGVVLGFALTTGAAEYGEYGQWSWSARATLMSRTDNRRLADLDEPAYSERGMQLFGGMSGFIVDPLIAAFDLALDTTLLQQQGGLSGDWTTLGYSGRVEVLPLSRLPVEARASKTMYDYSAATTEDPLVLFSRPVDSTTYGLRSRVTQGPLRGLLVNLTSTSDNTAGPEGPERLDRSFGTVDWSRAGKVLQHARFDYSSRNYGELGFTYKEIDSLYTLASKPAREWAWNLSSNARQNVAGSGTGDRDSYGRLSLGTQLTRERESGQALSFGYSGDVARPNGGTLFQSHVLSSSMTQPIGSRTWVSPTVLLGIQQGGSTSAFIPQAWVSITHSRTYGRASIRGTAGVGYSVLSFKTEKRSGDESRLSTDFSLESMYAGPGTSSTSFEAYMRTNDFRSSEEIITGIPDDTMNLSGAGTLDRTGLRLRHEWHRGTLHTALDCAWDQTESSGGFSTNSVSGDASRIGLQAEASRLGITLGAGTAKVNGTETTSTEYRSASLHLALIRNLQVSASYRTDSQMRKSTPNFDSVIWDAGATYQIGLLSVELHAYDIQTDVPGTGTRHDSGYRATISRYFEGLLPFVTTPRQRGVVR